MTDENERKPKDPGVYRESPPDAPPPAPVQPTEFQRQLQTDAEAEKFQHDLRNPMTASTKKKVGMAALGGMGCVAILLWLVALAGVAAMVVIGLIIFTCSR